MKAKSVFANSFLAVAFVGARGSEYRFASQKQKKFELLDTVYNFKFNPGWKVIKRNR